jgi:hypothetical protein
MDLNAAVAAIKEAVERQPTADPKVIVIDEFENLPALCALDCPEALLGGIQDSVGSSRIDARGLHERGS